MYSCTQRDFRQNLTNFMFFFMSFTRFSRIRALFHEFHVVFHEFHVFFMNCTFFSWTARFFHEFHVFFMNFSFFSWISGFFHEFHVFFMNFTFFFLWISCFFHEFHVFFMNSTFFSSVSRVSHVFVHARGFEPRTKENIGNLVLAHIFGRCIPILQPKLVKKEVFKYIFAKMYTNTANQKDCGMDPPPHTPLGTWMERLQALKVLSDIPRKLVEIRNRNQTTKCTILNSGTDATSEMQTSFKFCFTTSGCDYNNITAFGVTSITDHPSPPK